jgi:Na+-driven multidrug efflux pump
MLGANGLLHLLNTPAEVFPLAAPFLVALGPAMLFDAWNASMAGVMRAHLRTRDTLVVLIIMHVSHLLLALPLMYGWGPLPALGLPGYAFALTVSRMIGLALHLLMWRVHLHIDVKREDWWRLPRRELAAVLHIGLPGAAENIAWRWPSWSAWRRRRLGARALATQAYVLQLMGGVMMFSIATGLAVEIVVGYLIGAGQLREAHRVVKRALARGLVVCVLIAAAPRCAAAGCWAGSRRMPRFSRPAPRCCGLR